jgi:hypothetical protein
MILITFLVKVHHTSISHSSQLRYHYVTVVSQPLYYVTAMIDSSHKSVTGMEDIFSATANMVMLMVIVK